MITVLELFIAVIKKVTKKMYPEKLGYVIRYEYDLYLFFDGEMVNKNSHIQLLILLDSKEEGG